jgi:hypothetical protein
MRDLPIDDDVRAREADALPLKLELGEDEMRGRRADVDADCPQAQPLRGDLAAEVVVIVPVMAVTVRVVRMRPAQLIAVG